MFDVGAYGEAGGVGLGVDGIAELGGFDQGPAALQERPLGGGPSPAIRGPALPEALQRRFPDSLRQGGAEAAFVNRCEAPHLPEQSFGIALQVDIIHSYIPLIWSRLNSRGLERMEKPAAAALAGSPSMSAPMETLPSATSVRNLTAAL